jgi:cysteine synthase A
METSANTLRYSSAIIITIGASTAVSIGWWWWFYDYHQRRRERRKNTILKSGYETLVEDIGTPLVKLHKLSFLLNRSIYVKMESLNPSGTGKDRAALNMLKDAESKGLLPSPTQYNDHDDLTLYPTIITTTTTEKIDEENGEESGDHTTNNTTETSSSSSSSTTTTTRTISAESFETMIDQALKKSRTGGIVVEGTSGSTGIALATLAISRGHGCIIVMPDDQAVEKQLILQSLNAVVCVVPTASISNPQHYVNVARKVTDVAISKHIQAVFVDQFENLSNYDVHYRQTGPEIVQQMKAVVDNSNSNNNNNNNNIHAFVMSSGTGGTISGIGTYLKRVFSDVRVVLVDPPGSSLYHKVEHGVAYAEQQSERTMKKHRYDTIAEGIGLDRVTQNFSEGEDCIDAAVRVTDQDAVDMAHYVLRTEGLWIGSSSAMNLVGAVCVAKRLPVASNVVTVICDGGQRHVTRFWNPSFLRDRGLIWPGPYTVPKCFLQDL